MAFNDARKKTEQLLEEAKKRIGQMIGTTGS